MTKPEPGPLSVSGPWDAVAPGYTAEMPFLLGPISERAIELVAPAPNAVVVDVACGPGTLALQLAPRVARVHALDFAPAMLEQLRTAADASGVSNVEARVGDGQALPYADASFDAGFSMFGLMFFPDRLKGFAELHRVLRPGGTAAVSSWAPVEESSLMTVLFGAIRVIDPSRPAPKRDMNSLENPDRLREEMASSGFESIVVHTVEQSLVFENDEGRWDRLVASSAPLMLLRQKLGEDEWSARSQLAKAYLGEVLGGPGARATLSTTAFIAVGRRPPLLSAP